MAQAIKTYQNEAERSADPDGDNAIMYVYRLRSAGNHWLIITATRSCASIRASWPNCSKACRCRIAMLARPGPTSMSCRDEPLGRS